jgi:hypothetical protein
VDQLIRYRFAERPRRGLAVAGIFLLKGILATPHLLLINALGSLAGVAAYVGYWVVAVTGQLPAGLQTFVAWYLRWYARTVGWYTGVTDVYPPFEPEPAGYLPDVDPPRNAAPSRGWAVAGILLPVKILAAFPHLIVLALLWIVVAVGSWIGFLVVAFTGRLPIQFQDLYIGTTQWSVRVMSWIFGLTDRYPPFDLEVHPTA